MNRLSAGLRLAVATLLIVAGGCTSARSGGLPTGAGGSGGTTVDAAVDRPTDAGSDLGRGGGSGGADASGSGGADARDAGSVDAGDGGSADAGCSSGMHSCGGACVKNNDVANCGTTCVPCPVPTGGTATCDGTSCGFTCGAGTHACGSSCASNTALASCGSSCDACLAPTGGTATCDGTMCGGTCPSGSKLCAGACIPNAQSCNGVCPSGTHDCSGTCQSNSSTNSCGATACTACTPPSNGSPTCNGTTCGFTCNSSFHNCNGACLSNSSVSSCGTTSCTPCTPPANATATCDGTSCGFTCGNGFHNCSGTCSSNTSTATCGSSCTPCTPPANATATCNGTSCGFTCTGGTTMCSGACVLTTSDPLNCGACGHSCQGGTCSGSVCQPVSLVNQPISAFNLVNALLADTSLYVFISTDPGGNNPYELWQIPINGSGTAVRVCVGIPPNFGTVAVGNGTVFWNQPSASGSGFDVVSSPVATCNPASPKHLFTTARSFGTDFVSDGPFYDPTTSEVIWLEQDSFAVTQKRLMRSAAAGGTPRQITMFNYGGSFAPVFFPPAQGAPERLFWTEDRGTTVVNGVVTSMYSLFYVATNLTGSTPVQLNPQSTGFTFTTVSGSVLLANDTSVIWNDTLTRIAPLPNGITSGTAPAFVASPNFVRLGTVDATTLYGTFSSLTPGTIAKCSIASCSPVTLLGGQSAAAWFLQDATSIYWVNMVLGVSPTSADALSATKLAK